MLVTGGGVVNKVFPRMHTIKGFRAVQTFALSSSSSTDSGGGKKSRIRRSKEERKTMVLSFIKTYQLMNNGNFPSLNLTHKEVGGSFYTVREIVREIIQENRVLGPALFPLEDDNENDIMQHFPVGTIAVQPLICSPSGVSDILRQHHEDKKQYHGEKSEDVKKPNEQEIECYVDVKANGSYTNEHAFESALLSNSVEQESHQNSNAEHVLVTPSSLLPEDINQESHENVEIELLSNIVEQESHQKGNVEHVLVTPSSLHHDDINQESHQSVESELLSNIVEQESHQSSNADYVAVTPASLHHEDINEESHQNAIAELVKHPEEDHLGSIQSSEEKGNFREPLHTAVEDSLVEPLPGNNTRPEVVVEIFPPRPVTQSQTINGFEGRPDKHRVPEETENDQETKNKFEDLSPEKVDGSLDVKASPSNGYASSEICESLITNETLVTDGKNVVIPEVDVLSTGKPVNAPKDKDTNENISGLDNKTLHQQTSTEIEQIIVDEDISSGSNKRHPTLDRTKLETWEKTSEKKKPSSVNEIDSVVALFKAFFVALVKFITK